ncbi:MAG: aldo/keto reductase family protein [Ardenticatenales bacterium]|nr:aldo/keto reductase family protein [Ardenticatenales bacterium]
MQYRRLGEAGMRVSEISIGGWLTIGGTEDEASSRAIITTAIDHGINFIDVADVYARGESEHFIGQIIKDYRRQDLVISSKVYWPMSDNINDRGLSRKHLMESIDNSLKRLGMDYLDIYYCHRYDPETPVEEVVRAMDDIIRAGKVIYWGTSVWTAEQITSAVEVAEARNAYRPQVEQPRYNMLDRHIEPDVIPTCKHYGIGLTVWSPLAQGILTGKYNQGIPEGSRGAETNWLKGELSEANVQRVRKLTEIAQGLGITVGQLALAWILRRPEISSVITGATSPRHVEGNVKASEVKLSSDVTEEIERILGDEAEM